MAKIKTIYVCQNCGAESPKWVGKCSSCGEWNTYVEEKVSKGILKEEKAWSDSAMAHTTNKPLKLDEIEGSAEKRIQTGDAELNRVLGGGIVKGSLVLIGGEPGIGKSTLMLQLALSAKHTNVLYVSGEESMQQIKMRADRIGHQDSTCSILSETILDKVFLQIKELSPKLVVIDSIQTLQSSKVESAPGSVSQVRESTAELMRFAKETQTPVFLIGHITKEGSIAGPKVLEHMVDTVLQFEGDRHMSYRILRTIKNRFGSTAELGIYEMQGTGLRQVSNPSEILISQKADDLSGVAIGATIEGNRPLLIELQSLVSTATYGTPQRSTTGFDLKRLNMLLAVLEKRGGMRFGSQDVFLNVAGGLRIDEPALDLAVCAALVSAYHDYPIKDDVAFAGEVGLGGEIRAVNRVESRIAEAEKLGFKEIYISSHALKGISNEHKIKIKGFSKLKEAFEELFG
jgi:DNA repair protein RadA/Sms